MPRELISANHAAAAAAILAGEANRRGRGFGAGVYPITPQTECIERLCAHRFTKGDVVRVESEHSAMGVCIGASLAGARTFTASSSNGLAYMAENVVAAGRFRLPVVMMAVNRTLGPPWNLWADHGDTLMLRDAGWMQFYCEDNQEVFDSILLAFRIAEDPRVLVPALVCQDAFVLSHTMMLTDLAEQAQVDAFLPPLELPHALGETPRVVGELDMPHDAEVHQREHAAAMDAVWAVYAEVQREFEARFGRRPDDPVVPYRLEDAEYVLVSMGTTAATVRAAVDQARADGVKAGALRLRVFRPFPEALLARHFAGRRGIGVIDRDLCPGLGGIVWAEARGCAAAPTVVQNYLLGVGGGDVRPHHVRQALDDLMARRAPAAPVFLETG